MCPVCKSKLEIDTTIRAIDDYDYSHICPSCFWSDEEEEAEELPF